MFHLFMRSLVGSFFFFKHIDFFFLPIDFFFFKSSPEDVFIDFREEGREREKSIDLLPPLHPDPGDRTHNLSM